MENPGTITENPGTITRENTGTMWENIGTIHSKHIITIAWEKIRAMYWLCEENGNSKLWIVLKDLHLGVAFEVGTNIYRDVGSHTPDPKTKERR